MLVSKALVALAVLTVSDAAPLDKRIAQTIADSTAKWEQACLSAGGGQLCNPQSQASFYTLLSAAGSCDQQNQGDAMIDLAKQLNDDPDMITLTQIFVQQPRNSPDSLSVPYCQQPPRNAELSGLFQCQFQGSNLTVFTGNTDVGGVGTIPFGQTAPLNPPGSCPANPSGPITAGSQLTDITSTPGVGAFKSASLSSTNSNANASTTTGSVFEEIISSSTSVAQSTTRSIETAAANRSQNPAQHDHEPSRHHLRAAFTLQNGLDAQTLNAQFQALTILSPCSDGTTACVNGEFAQCSSGTFALTTCSSGLQCFALPLVNSAGTSITCDSLADAEARIAATGATGGLTGSGSSQKIPTETSVMAAAPTASPANAGHGSVKHIDHDKHHKRAAFTLQNGLDAQSLNAQFTTLTISSPCTDGTSACVNGEFAQCSGGMFALSSCSSGLQCFALPLVNSAGTSITCDTLADAVARIAATGASGGIAGTDIAGSASTLTTSAAASSSPPESTSLSSSTEANAVGSDRHATSKQKAHGAPKHF